MKKILCPICGQKESDILFHRKDLVYAITEDYFTVVRCKNCDTSYINPCPTIDEIKKYYPNEFYRTHLDKEMLLHKQCFATHLKIKNLPNILSMDSTSRLLDIGCSRGEFLYAMKSFGFTVYGVEFNERAISPFDIDIFHGTLQQAAFPDNYFDIVTMWAVLEHVHAPLTLLDEVLRVLKPGGQLTLLVTNMRSFPARIMQVDDIPRHLILFSPKSLTHTLAMANFTKISLKFNHRLYGSTHAGMFIFLYKMMRGMSAQEIVEERHADWGSYTQKVRGKPDKLLKKIASFDAKNIAFVDKIMDKLGYGLNIIATAYKQK